MQEAIERNTKTYDVVFERSDFISKESSKLSRDKSETQQENLTVQNQNSTNSHQTTAALSSASNNPSSNALDTSIASKNGNFGTPSVEKP